MNYGVIFDLDGTILNTLDDLADAGNHALSEFGYPIHDTQKYRYFVGNGIPKLVERILPEKTPADVYEQTYERFCSYYGEHKYDKTHPYDGMTQMLTNLHEKGIKLAVVTNKDHVFACEMVERYFGNLFDDVFGSVEGFPKKPDPYWVNEALKKIGVAPENAVYVGDSSVDMLTAKAAGVFSCGVLWGFRERDELVQNGACVVASDCVELKKIILDRIGK